MPLFLVAVIEPPLLPKFQGDIFYPEMIVLPPTPVLAENQESAEVQATLLANSYGDKPSHTDSRRWKVITRPFG